MCDTFYELNSFVRKTTAFVHLLIFRKQFLTICITCKLHLCLCLCNLDIIMYMYMYLLGIVHQSD